MIVTTIDGLGWIGAMDRDSRDAAERDTGKAAPVERAEKRADAIDLAKSGKKKNFGGTPVFDFTVQREPSALLAVKAARALAPGVQVTAPKPPAGMMPRLMDPPPPPPPAVAVPVAPAPAAVVEPATRANGVTDDVLEELRRRMASEPDTRSVGPSRELVIPDVRPPGWGRLSTTGKIAAGATVAAIVGGIVYAVTR